MEKGLIGFDGSWVAVIGSRTVTNKEYVRSVLDKNTDKISVIISGGAKGPDSFAEEWAKEKGKPFIGFYAKWYDKNGIYDKGAGMKRNVSIIKNSDIVLAFYDGVSKGTGNSIELAKHFGKKLKIIIPPEFKQQQVEPAKQQIDFNPEDFQANV